MVPPSSERIGAIEFHRPRLYGHVFLSMEYIYGEALAHILARMGRPSQEEGIEIACQFCFGLAAVHDNGVQRRDVKPANATGTPAYILPE